MALLGKTLKGRSTKPGAQKEKRNTKPHPIAKTQQEYDEFLKFSKIKREDLKKKAQGEQKIVNYNQKKLLTYWRKIMRIAKTEQMKNDIDIYSQNNQRELDSKDAFIQMLDKNIDEAEDQYQVSLRNHLIHLEDLMLLQNSRLRGLHEEFERDVKLLEEEFDREREEMIRNQRNKVKEVEDMIETVREEEKNKTEEAYNEHQTFRETTKNKNMEDHTNMTALLDAKKQKYYNDLEQLHQKYSSDTDKKTKEHAGFFDVNRRLNVTINNLVRNIDIKKANIDLMKLKILQHTKEFQARNLALKKEKENIQKNYQELKLKMMKFREEEQRRLTELVNNSRNAVLKLKDYTSLGEKIVKTAELCRRLETEKEKVLPFYENSVEDTEIPEELKPIFMEITPQIYKEFSYLNNFYKRYNKVLLDKLAITKQKESLQKDNLLLKSLLKQYLDGISLNDDVLKNNNPLFVVNNKINISKLPVEPVGCKTVLEGAFVIENINKQKN